MSGGRRARNIRELCRRFGISAPTGYKWIERHGAGGEPALHNVSRRPHASPSRSDAAIEAAVLKVRDQHPAWGARKIRAVLEASGRSAGVPAASTVHAILVRHGKIDPAQGEKHRPCQRFVRERPNALWQMDFKGHVPLHRGGRRCHPLTILDDYSRYAVALRACDNEREPTVREHLIDVFRRFGLPETLLADNGPPWGTPLGELGHTRLTVWLLRLGVRVIHGRPCHPQTQGKAERFHRTLKAELLGRTELRDLSEAQEEFDAWRGVYNMKRPHEAIGMRVPATCYEPSERAYPERLPEFEYGPGDIVRRVHRDGMLVFAARRWYISEALVGQRVALRATNVDGVLNVCLGPHEVGTLDQRDGTRRAARRRPQLAALAPDDDGKSTTHL
ncbi:MAG: IS481 family transposase [Phycisphaeraceae bacterium]|nr:IS481 family transposase [Phycisphaeraceae bacterium]